LVKERDGNYQLIPSRSQQRNEGTGSDE